MEDTLINKIKRISEIAVIRLAKGELEQAEADFWLISKTIKQARDLEKFKELNITR